MSDRDEILDLMARFANSFDTKQWARLGECLDDRVTVDYSDLRGTPRMELSRSEFVGSRMQALDKLQTHHLLSNFEVNIQDDSATVTASAVIFRRVSDGESFDTHCIYAIEMARKSEKWLITALTQQVLWNEGNSSIHAGARPKSI